MSLFSENLVQSEHSSASSVISVLPTVPPPPDFQSSRKSSFPDLSPSILPSGALSALPILTSSTLSSLSPTQSYFVISSTDEDYDVGSATILFDSGMAEGSASTPDPSEQLGVGVESASQDSHVETSPDNIARVQNSLNPSSVELWDHSTVEPLDDLAHKLGVHPRAVLLSSSAETVNIFTDLTGSSPELVSTLTPSSLGTTSQSLAQGEENRLVMETMKGTESSHQLSTVTSEIDARSFSNEHDDLTTPGSVTADKSADTDRGSASHSDSMTVDGEHVTSVRLAPSSAVTEQTFQLSPSLSDAVISSPSSSTSQPESDASLMLGVNRLSTGVSDLSLREL